jgi:hypothetical protein
VVEGVFRVHDVERRVGERELFRVGDPEGEPGLVAPVRERLDVDRDDLRDTLADQPRNAAVPAATVERALVAAEREAELVEAAQPVAELAARHTPPLTP